MGARANDIVIVPGLPLPDDNPTILPPEDPVENDPGALPIVEDPSPIFAPETPGIVRHEPVTPVIAEPVATADAAAPDAASPAPETLPNVYEPPALLAAGHRPQQSQRPIELGAQAGTLIQMLKDDPCGDVLAARA
jgi:hypothetical protein